MRVRSNEEIRESLLKSFQKDYPGEKVTDTPFSIYVLDAYCRLVEIHEFYRHMMQTRNDL